ncbi:MAG: glycosyltransferase family 2 protein [Candidatus Micrarchaeota archaeon]|nr:glycosyltransferase family 2 protein [Candidatus Micrarchaeota archaeon]
MKMPYLSIVIPTLNEEKNIRALINGIKPIISGYPHEIIIIDGHSKDRTAQIARSMGAKVIYDSVGKGSALINGFKAAKGDIIISMDADLSHRPNEMKILIAGIEAGYDICVGSRFLTGGGSDDMPAFRRFGNKVFVSLVNLIYGSKYTDMCYGYRSFAKGVANRLGLKEMGFGIETEINIQAQKNRMKVLEVPSYEKLRAAGQGKLRSFKDGAIILKTIMHNMHG